MDAVVIAVPPRFHLDLDAARARRRQARAGREAGVSADGGLSDGHRRAGPRRRVVLVGENDHYKPLAVTCGSCSPRARSARWCSRTSRPSRRRLKTADDWRNDEAMAGGDAFFEEGIHWLHIAGSLGPRIVAIEGFRPSPSRAGPGQAREEHDGGVPVRQRRRRIAVLLARDSLALAWRCVSRSCSAATASSPSNRTALFVLVRGDGAAAADLSRVPRHPRLPGDVSRLRARHPRGPSRRR